MPRILAAALAFAATLTAVPALAQGLDLRAASQRTCLEAAERAGLDVRFIARPVPIMARLGEVWGETVRMQVASGGGVTWLRCTYEIGIMEAELRWH
jgi:DNA-binding IclR family transcriptional regulator